jgi:hypothetical protein
VALFPISILSLRKPYNVLAREDFRIENVGQAEGKKPHSPSQESEGLRHTQIQWSRTAPPARDQVPILQQVIQ